MSTIRHISALVLTLLFTVLIVQPMTIHPVAAQEDDLAFLDFENGVDGQVIASSIPGVAFSNTAGFDWAYGDVRTGNYNAPYPADCPSFGGICAYAMQGNFFAWMGPVQGDGRIDFTQGTATRFIADFSTGENLTVEAYNAAGQMLDSASLGSNLRTGRLDTVSLQGAGLAYVLIRGTENRWLMDNMYADAPGIPGPEGSRPDDDDEDEDSSHTVVSVFSNPNISVPPGGMVTYTILVRNIGAGDADNVIVSLPFDPAEVQVVNASFSQEQAWVRTLAANKLVFETGRILHSGGVMTATVRMNTLPTAPMGASLSERLIIEGSGVEVGRDRSNLLPLVTGGAAVHQPFYPLTASPTRAPAGSVYTFTSNNFIPNEPVTFWYNTPSGTAIEIGMVNADTEGMVNEAFISASSIPPGSYSMVSYGNWSTLTATTTFVVEGGSGGGGT